MNPLLLVMVQTLQALGLYTIVQGAFIALLSLMVLFAAINYFRNGRG